MIYLLLRTRKTGGHPLTTRTSYLITSRKVMTLLAFDFLNETIYFQTAVIRSSWYGKEAEKLKMFWNCNSFFCCVIYVIYIIKIYNFLTWKYRTSLGKGIFLHPWLMSCPPPPFFGRDQFSTRCKVPFF